MRNLAKLGFGRAPRWNIHAVTLATIPAMTVGEGLPYPLGATWDGTGVNFPIFSANATGVEVCIFDESGERATSCLPAHLKMYENGRVIAVSQSSVTDHTGSHSC